MDEQVSNAQAVCYIGLIFVCAFLFFSIVFIPPAEAATWGDKYTSDTTASYSKSLYWNYNGTSHTWDGYRSAVSNMGETKLNVSKYGGGIYSINITPVELDSTGALKPAFVFGDALSTSTTYGSGNKYTVMLYNTTTGGSAIYVYRTVASSATQIGTISTPIYQAGVSYNLRVNWTPYALNSIGLSLDGGSEYRIIDSTFARGYPGYYSHTGNWTRFDDFFINETPAASFSCSSGNPATCTQSGANFADPGVRSWWVWGDGTTSNEVNGTHTYLPGTYTVSLLNENVAGSSSEVKRDYLTISPVSQLIINPSIHQKCPWWHFGIWC